MGALESGESVTLPRDEFTLLEWDAFEPLTRGESFAFERGESFPFRQGESELLLWGDPDPFEWGESFPLRRLMRGESMPLP